MKAVVYDTYGSPDVLRIREIAKPVPADNEVLVKVHATTVSSADWRARSLIFPRGFGFMGRLVFGLSRPRQPILGTELSGEIEAIGKDVRNFKVGEGVFAFTGAKMGCHDETKIEHLTGDFDEQIRERLSEKAERKHGLVLLRIVTDNGLLKIEE